MASKQLFILFLLISFQGKSQYDSEGADLISRFRPGVMWFNTGLRPAELEKVRKYDRLVFDVTYNTWNGDLESHKSQWNSLGLNTNVIFDLPLTKHNTISFGTGFSHSIFRINTTNQLFTPDSTNSFTQHDFIETFAPEKRFLGGNSFSIPLELRFRSKGWKHFKFHVGGKVGYQFNVFSKTKMNGVNGEIVQKTYDFPDVNRLVYSAHVRFGLRNWALYASYNFNPIFSNENSVKLNLLQFGLSISLF